jgi:hypothetical protein
MPEPPRETAIDVTIGIQHHQASQNNYVQQTSKIEIKTAYLLL